MKQCPACAKLGIGPKIETEFNKGSDTDGLQNACREHTRAASRAWAKANPERNREKTKRWREKNPQAWRNISTNTRLINTYGISYEKYADMWNAQKGGCAICEKLIAPVGLAKQKIDQVGCVDHCHETGRVRGLLCFDCNTGLGKFQDSEKLLLKAARYLHESATASAQPDVERNSSK